MLQSFQDPRRRHLLIMGFAAFFLLGAQQAMYGPSLPLFRAKFGLEVDQVSAVVSAQFLGAFLAAAWAREFRFQGFEGERQMRRSMLGAGLMGFGAMLAGGCAIGAGVTGTSIFVGTAWLALLCMWIGAMLTDFLVDRNPRPALAAA